MGHNTKGDVWVLGKNSWIVIPTNIGWKKDGSNVMGRGLAKQAAIRFPKFPYWYGAVCRKYAENSIWPLDFYPILKIEGSIINDKYTFLGLIPFPVKKLNRTQPHYSWSNPADLETIAISVKVFMQKHQKYVGKAAVYFPLIGCGNGGLDWKDVKPITQPILNLHNIILVHPE